MAPRLPPPNLRSPLPSQPLRPRLLLPHSQNLNLFSPVHREEQVSIIPTFSQAVAARVKQRQRRVRRVRVDRIPAHGEKVWGGLELVFSYQETTMI